MNKRTSLIYPVLATRTMSKMVKKQIHAVSQHWGAPHVGSLKFQTGAGEMQRYLFDFFLSKTEIK